LTTKGVRCTRSVEPPAIYCWQHRNCKTPIGKKQAQPKTTLKKSLNETNPIGRFLTGIPDVDILILLDMDEQTLAAACRTDKYAKSICNNDNFWRQKFLQLPTTYKNKVKPTDKTWREYYREWWNH
jgi:hypothetical protein